MKTKTIFGTHQARIVLVTPQERAPRVMFVTTVAQSLRFYRDQIQYLQRHGFRVSAASSDGEDQRTIGQESHADMYPVPMSRSISPVSDVMSVWRLVQAMRHAKPDIVHAATPKGGLIGMIAATWCRRPHRIYHILGLPYLTATGPKRLLFRMSERISCQLATRVFCVSPSIREIAIADGLVPADRIVVIGNGSVNGVDSDERFHPRTYDRAKRSQLRQELGIASNDPVVGYVGRVVRDKGIDDLMAAWAIVLRTVPRARLVIVGALEPHDPISTESLELLNNHPSVIVTGHIDDPAPYYAIFNIVALPTWREGFGNVLIEAASMGLPTVTTTVPGAIDAIVDGVTGTAVPPRDHEALAAAIRRYLLDPELRDRHGHAGRERVVTRFTRERIWKESMQEYLRLLRRRRSLIDLRVQETEVLQ
jgi:glycosyltransferase involved in cell wall biosynthesis